MASIDEMLFDALRRSNPIGRVIEDFKRAQPALQAASTAPTGAAEALIGKLMVSPAFRTSATEEEARRRALEQDDLFVKALEATGKDLSVETFLQTLNDGFSYSVDGVVGKSTWPENHGKPVPCAVMTEVKDSKFVTIQDLVCGENIEIG